MKTMTADSAPRIRLEAHNDLLRLAEPFHITGRSFDRVPVTRVTLRQGGARGRGEAAGVYYTGDDPERMLPAVEALRERLEAGLDRDTLRQCLPAGGARNAIDCALWELEAQLHGQPVWELAGLSTVRPLLTTFTAGADTPEKMAARAASFKDARAIKLKLTGDPELDSARVRAVRRRLPQAWIGVDANQGYDAQHLPQLIPALLETGVALLEQPCARGRETDMDGIGHVIPIAADESILTLAELEEHHARFDVVNIKLDKCGGLTEGLLIARRAKELGLKVMVGNMVGTSLAMAPAWVLGQHCDVVDLDGPVVLEADVSPGVVYRDGHIHCADDIWGAPA